MLAKACGDSDQLPDETGRLDSASAKVFKTPGTVIANIYIFLSSRQVPMRGEMSQRGFDLHQPNLLIYLAAVVLSIWISTEQPRGRKVSECFKSREKFGGVNL